MAVDSKIEEFRGLKASNFRYLKTFKVMQGEDLAYRDSVNDHMNLFLEFTTTHAGPKFKILQLEFKGVRQLQIQSLEGMRGYLLQIDSVKDSQMEDLNYKIVEEDWSAFSFYCRDFTGKICDA